MIPLPPGLNNDIEIWADAQGNVFILNNGQKSELKEVDTDIFEYFIADMKNHPAAIACLELMGIRDCLGQVQKYLCCRYGNFDSIPDFGIGSAGNPDHYHCDNRGACKYEGKLCDKVKVKNGFLTHQEISVIRHIAEDLADKQIAGQLNISTNTVTTHVQNILKKLEVHSRVGICRFAIEHNI